MSFIDHLKELTALPLRKTLHHLEENIGQALHLAVKRLSHYVVKELVSACILLAALIFFALAGTFFAIEYLALSKTIAFLITGIILLLIGLIVKLRT